MMDTTSLQYGIDPIAFVAALVAIGYTAREARRNNAVVLRILESSYVGRNSVHENRQQPFTQYTLIIRNLGIPLHSTTATLTFQEFGGHGVFNIPLLRRNSQGAGNDEFGKGMIAEFGLKSYELRPFQSQMLLNLRDPARQSARLVIGSQGYEAKRFQIGGPVDQVRTSINRSIGNLRWRFRRRVRSPDRKRQLLYVPEFCQNLPSLTEPLMRFVEGLDLTRSPTEKRAA